MINIGTVIKNAKALYLFTCVENKLSISSNDIAFISTSRIGDNVFVMSLASEIKKHHNANRIILVLPQKLQKLTDIFEGIDEVIYQSDAILENICFSYFGYIKGMKYPQKGRLNIAHPASLEKIVGDGFNFLDAIKLQVGIPLSTKLRPPKEIPHDIAEKILEKLLNQNVNPFTTVLVSLESRAVRFSDEEKIMILNRVLKYFPVHGYTVILNEEKWFNFVKKEYTEVSEMVRYLNLDLFETFVIGKILKKIISVRSGWTDLMAFTESNMVVFYPNRPSLFLVNPTRYIDYFPASKMFQGINNNILDVELGFDTNFENVFEYLLR